MVNKKGTIQCPSEMCVTLCQLQHCHTLGYIHLFHVSTGLFSEIYIKKHTKRFTCIKNKIIL